MSAEFISGRPLEVMVERARHDLEAWFSLAASFPSDEQMETGLAPRMLASMRRSRRLTKESIKNSDPNGRMAALWLVQTYYTPDIGFFASSCLDAAFADTHATVRGAALTCLVQCRNQIRDPNGELEAILREVLGEAIDEWDASVEKACDEMEENAEIIGRHKDRQRQYWADVAGAALDQMLSERAGVESFLQHWDPKLRVVALEVLADHWGPDERAANYCLDVLGSDADPEVVCASLNLLADFYRASEQASEQAAVTQVVANIVLDESRDVSVREAAYKALHAIQGTPVLAMPKAWCFAFPFDVDWEFVRYCAR